MSPFLGTQQQFDAIHHKAFGEKRSEQLVMHPGIERCYQDVTEFASHANDYAYDPFIRAKQFEKSTGIRLLRKG